jgi:hypothetical protein
VLASVLFITKIKKGSFMKCDPYTSAWSHLKKPRPLMHDHSFISEVNPIASARLIIQGLQKLWNFYCNIYAGTESDGLNN